MVSGVGNNLLKWETVEDWNVGVDMSFLDSRLDITFEYFQKKSSDMLYQKQNIFAIGYPDWNSTVWMNIGSMKASGWELSLNWHDKVFPVLRAMINPILLFRHHCFFCKKQAV